MIFLFPAPLRNRFISGGLEPVLSHTEKLCITSYYIQFSVNVKVYKHTIKISFYPRKVVYDKMREITITTFHKANIRTNKIMSLH